MLIDLSEVAGFPVELDPSSLILAFGPGVTTAPVTVRRLDEVRSLLRDPGAAGPDHLYTIYMDIRVPGRAEALRSLGLGYGAVVYNHGALGGEALRSQGHVHSAPPRPASPTPRSTSSGTAAASSTCRTPPPPP